MLYLLIDEKKDFALLKIGYTEDLNKREQAYKTANPLIKKVAYMKRLGREAEKEFQLELGLLGFNRIDKTEWYKVPHGVADFIANYGFNAFATKNAYRERSFIYGTEKCHKYPKLNLKDYV